MEKKIRVLLIDGDEVSIFLNLELLRELDIIEDIKVITDGVSGCDFLLEHCREARGLCPHLVIFADIMPGLDGLELMKELKASKLNQGIVYFMLGINTPEREVGKYNKLGVQEIAHRPLTEKDIMEVYRKYWE